jgi:hypothetical protein
LGEKCLSIKFEKVIKIGNKKKKKPVQVLQLDLGLYNTRMAKRDCNSQGWDGPDGEEKGRKEGKGSGDEVKLTAETPPPTIAYL